MTRKLLIIIITSLVISTINGQADDDFMNNGQADDDFMNNGQADDDFMNNDAIEQTPEPERSGSPQPSEESTTNVGSTQETSEKNPNIPEAPSTESSSPAQEVTTQSNRRTTIIDGQAYAIMPAPNPFPNLGPPPFYMRPQPPQPPHYPQMMPFMPMPYPMMFPPPMPPMMKPGDAPNYPGSQVILFNQQNPGDAVVGQSTVYLKPDGNREIIIIK